MMDDLQARLDAAITEARAKAILASDSYGFHRGVEEHGLTEVCQRCTELDSACDGMFDHYAALVALRARISEHVGDDEGAAERLQLCCPRGRELTAEAERLLGSGEDA